jgi:tRNA A37 threonylcarbamoyladenosine synthetase subunit TsaC/SUA5/YrdC
MLLTIHPRTLSRERSEPCWKQLNNGGVVVCPTDTVYAFVCSGTQCPGHRSDRAIERGESRKRRTFL